jgi:hypothetical protein
MIAEAGIWGAALTDAEVASLASGTSPDQVRRDSLLSYYRLRNIGDLMDFRGGTDTMVAYNTPVSAGDHCRVVYQSAPNVRIEQTVAPVIYGRVGRRFLFTDANWDARTWYFEATMRRQAGTAQAKLYDITAGADVANSEITTVSGTMTRVRSAAITLVDGHEYEVMFGATSVDEGRGLGASIIGIL